MRKKSKRLTALLLSLLMVISLLPTTGLTVEAAAKPKLAKKSVSIVVGGKAKIKVKNAPKKAKITYKSAKKNIATVSKKGTVKGIKSGTTKITVSIKKNSKTTKLIYKVTVKKPKLSKSKLSLVSGKTAKLSVKNRPKKAKYTWKSSNPRIVTVNKTGKVTAKAKGTAIIRVKVKTTKKTYSLSCKVTVKAKPGSSNDINQPKYKIDFQSSYGGEVKASSGEYVAGTIINIEATPYDGWMFSGWQSTDGGTFGDSSLMSTKYETPAHNSNVIAVFTQIGQENANADELAVYNAYNALQIEYKPGDYQESVTQNLVLISNYGEEDDGVNIAWTSSDENIIDKEGNVKRPNESDYVVVLTALISKGNYSQEKQFTVTVKKADNQNREEINNNSVLDINNLNEMAEYPVDISYSDNGEQVTSIDGKYSEIIVDSPETAMDSLYSVKSLIGITDPESELKCIAVNHDDVSLTYTFSQVYGGIGVYGTTVTVSVNKETGEVQTLHSSVISTHKLLNLDLMPQITEEEIKELYSKEGNILSCELQIYSLDEYFDAPIMAYVLTTQTDVIIISADDGNEILRFQSVCDLGDHSTTGKGKTESGNTVTFPIQFHLLDFYFYYMEDVERQIFINGDKASPISHEFNTSWGDETANSAYTNVIKTYDWYKEHLNRKSLDNNGMAIQVNVHNFKKETGPGSTNNAHWDGNNKEICFFENSGLGYSTPTTANGLDIIAHEMTHGVFQYILSGQGVTSFPYSNFTGSINEGYADVFGYFVDNDDWTMGEDWRTIRSLERPESYECPSRYMGEYYYTGKDQSTLVHTNSSLVYHAAYLMNTYGISNSKLEKLWYNSMSQGYDARSDFYTVRENLIKAAKNNNFTDSELSAVRKAFDTEDIYNELGNLKINFVDIDGNSIDLGGQGNTFITLERTKKDVPVTEISLNENVGSSVIIGNSDTNGNQSKLTGNMYYGNYTLNITASGYVPFNGMVTINKGEVAEITVPLVEEGNGKAGGVITSATTGLVVDGVSLKVYSGWNKRSGDVLYNGSNASDGTYSLELPAGFYTLSMEKDEYTTGYLNLIVTSGKELMNQNASISPIMEFGNDFRVVLTWGSNPRDLDSHLIGTNPSGTQYHIYYSDRNAYDADGNLVANLDVDDTSSYGPETTTFTAFTGGNYEFYIDWFSGSGTWATSGGKVEVYNGEQLLYVFDVPQVDSQSGDWKVFTFNNGIFKAINEIQ